MYINKPHTYVCEEQNGSAVYKLKCEGQEFVVVDFNNLNIELCEYFYKFIKYDLDLSPNEISVINIMPYKYFWKECIEKIYGEYLFDSVMEIIYDHDLKYQSEEWYRIYKDPWTYFNLYPIIKELISNCMKDDINEIRNFIKASPYYITKNLSYS